MSQKIETPSEKWKELEDRALKQYPKSKGNVCLDCGIKTRYFNQCERCYEKMIAIAKAMY
jgi:methionine synthase II (cobalamin-independent)